MIVRVVATMSVQRPLSEVFAFISKVEYYPQYHSRAVVTWRATTGPVTAGDRWWARFRVIGAVRQLEFRVTSYELDRRFMSWSEGNRFPFGSGCELETLGDAIRVTCVREMRLEGWRKLLRPAVGVLLQREINREAAELQRELSFSVPRKIDQSSSIS